MNHIRKPYSIDYFKGIFHTYAEQNDPGINIYYDFDIEEFTIESSLKESFINSFPSFKHLEFEFFKITKYDFIQLLDKWFYIEFIPNSKKQRPTSALIENIVEELIFSFDIIDYYQISNIKNNGKDVSKELGLVVDFALISNKSNAYFCEFLMDG
jgi:hypothetical protein